MNEGHVIWITGLSGSGKTTLSQYLSNLLIQKKIPIVNLDGDAVRKLVSSDLDYSESSRIRQVNRIRNIAKVICDQNVNVIVSVLYSNPELLLENRIYFKNYHEIYINVSIKKLVERDSKKLYTGFLEGNLKNVVGMDIDWIPPLNPDLEFVNDNFLSLDFMSKKIIKRLRI